MCVVVGEGTYGEVHVCVCVCVCVCVNIVFIIVLQENPTGLFTRNEIQPISLLLFSIVTMVTG